MFHFCNKIFANYFYLTYICNMKTEAEALEYIFKRQNSNTYRTWKRRWKLGKLSRTTIEYILKENGFILKVPAKYKKCKTM